MALRQIRLTRALQELRASLKAKLDEQAKVRERRAAWKTREEAAEAALQEIVEDTIQEEKDALDAEIADLEKEDEELKAKEAELEAAVEEAETKIAEIEAELEKLADDAPAEPAPAPVYAEPVTESKRSRGNIAMHRITNNRLNTREVREMLRGDAGKRFAADIRQLATRGVTGATLTVPTVFLPLMVEMVSDYSKLYPYLNIQQIKGDGKQNILAAVPEAVWTANTGKLNELALAFYQLLIDTNKVAGYVPIPNPYLQDSDEDLAAIALETLGQSIGKAVDKAAIYGTGTNMPIGIMTRLAAESSPAWWQANQPTFTDLHSSNIGKLSGASVTGSALYKEMLTVLGKVRDKCRGGKGGKFWVMNETTWTKLKIEALAFNAAGAIVAGMEDKMPIIGGDVVELDFIPNDAVIGGYGNNYVLGERAGVQLASSEHAMFIEDNTVFRGIARYDGRPAFGEAFAAFALTNSANPASTTTFAEDTANAEPSGSET